LQRHDNHLTGKRSSARPKDEHYDIPSVGITEKPENYEQEKLRGRTDLWDIRAKGGGWKVKGGKGKSLHPWPTGRENDTDETLPNRGAKREEGGK